MAETTRFLQTLAQTLSTMSLYKTGHPARERVIDRSFALLQDLLTDDNHPDFSFMGDEVIYKTTSIRELRDWDWSKRFAQMGIQRLEIDVTVTREEFVGFLDEVSARLATPGSMLDTTLARQTAVTSIRWGELGIRSETEEGRKILQKEIQTATIKFAFNEEIDAIKYMHEEVLKNGGLPLLEAGAGGGSPSLAVHGGGGVEVPPPVVKGF